jgi:hypothetical protein
MFKKGEVRFRTFNIIELRRVGTIIGKVTACVRYMGLDWFNRPEFIVGLSYCSPKEKQFNRKYGQYIALRRLMSNNTDGRGPATVFLQAIVGQEVSLKGLTQEIKTVIIKDSRRKNIRWMKGIQDKQIV